MKGSFLIIFIIIIFNCSFVFGQKETDWKLVKSSNGIKAYTQNQTGSKIKRVKVEALVQATLSQLISLLKDADNHKEWVYFNKSARMIEVESEYQWKYYGYSDSPWPVSDRDFITEVVLSQDSIDYSVTLISCAIPTFLPVTKDCVRIPYINSKWYLNPVGNGSVYIVFELAADIGGKIPAWLFNLAITKGPLSTMEGLIEQIETKYKNTNLDYIKELV